MQKIIFSYNAPMIPTIYIFSGPAWAGKTTLWEAIKHRVPHIEKVITSTTRGIRPNEQDGRDYHFLSLEAFRKKIAENDLIEYAEVHTSYYGSTYSELDRILRQKKSPIYIIEPQGMMSLKPLLTEKWYQVVTIFVEPPSLDVLESRLNARGSETPENLKIRMQTAQREMTQTSAYDHVFVNDDFKVACDVFVDLLSR